jgi:hypothetical protein
MVEVRHLERLTPEARELYEAGEDVRLHDLQNVAAGLGRAVMELTGFGIWRLKAIEPDGGGYRVWIHGPF